MKVFISQLMRERNETEILNERSMIAEYVRNKFPADQIEFIDNYFSEWASKEKGREVEYPGVFYLGRSIIELSSANLAIFGPGWDKGRGTWIEWKIAGDYGIPTMFVDEEDLT